MMVNPLCRFSSANEKQKKTMNGNCNVRHTHRCQCRNTIKTKVFTCAPFFLWITCHPEYLLALQRTNEKATRIKGATQQQQQARNLLRNGENVFSRKAGKIKGDNALKRHNEISSSEIIEVNNTSVPVPGQVKILSQEDCLDIVGTETRQGNNSNICQLNDQGIYGDTSDPSSTQTIVSYLYQVSVAQGTSTSVVTNRVIPEVDRAITTAMLPSFFDCSGNQRRRIQENRTVLAFSSQPIDGFVAMTCPKIVPDSDCYIGQGTTTAYTTGLSRRQVKQQVTDAAQVAMQSNDLSNSIASNLVLDITPLTDDLQTFAPIGSQTSQPIAASPSTLTFAPVPLLSPTFAPSPLNLEPTTKSPTQVPSMSFPDTPTRFPASSPQIEVTFPPTNSPLTFAPVIISETEKPTNSFNLSSQEPSGLSQDDNKSKEGAKNVDWWAWLLASLGGVFVLTAFFAVFKWLGRRQTSPPPSPNGALPVDIGCLGIGSRTDGFPHEKSGATARSASKVVPASSAAVGITPGAVSSQSEQHEGQVPSTNHEVETVDEKEEFSIGAEKDIASDDLEEEEVIEEEVDEHHEEETDEENEEEVEDEHEEVFDDDQDEGEEELVEEEGHNVLDREQSYHNNDDEDMYYEEVEEVTEEEEASQDKWSSSQRF